MGKILSERLAGPDDPIYREPVRSSYPPHWSRRWITVNRAAMAALPPFRSSGQAGSRMGERGLPLVDEVETVITQRRRATAS